MTTYLDLTNKALDLWHSVHGTESLDQQCQREAGYYTSWAYLGTEAGIIGYATAKAAALASPIGGHSINSAPVGSYVYWSVGSAWHVGVIVGYDGGRALVAYATTKGDTVLALRHGVKVSHADTYPATFYGWSVQNGKNKPISGLAAWSPNPASGLTVAQVKVLSAYLNGRAGSVGKPGTTAVSDGVPGKAYWTLVQAIGHADGLYPTPQYGIDGVPGPKTLELEQHYYVVASTLVTPPPVDPPVSPPVDPPADPPVDDPTDPPADPPADDTPPDEPEGPGEADPSDPDDPTDPPVDRPSVPARPGGWIAALVVGVIALVGGILATIFGS